MRNTNWGGNVTFGAARVHHPSTVAELCDLVAGTPRLHALGSKHSFSTVADSPGDLVSLDRLPPDVDTDSGRRTVRVAAGLTYAELAAELDGRGLAVANLASLPHITVAGCCATCTHGSGNANGSLATSVAAFEMVTADGELITVARGDKDFDGSVVGLGALGIVTALTLDVLPSFQVRQWVYQDLPRQELDASFDAIFASAYSVSVFTTWRDPARLNQVWVKHLDGDGWRPAPRWMGATLARTALHPVPGMAPGHCTDQAGVPGPWHERLPHFRPQCTPSTGEELQSEYLLPRGDGVAALAALDPLAERIAELVLVFELRTVAADDLWLSPCYGRDTVGFHFSWRKTPAVTALLPEIEARLAPFGARPHWGKVFTMAPPAVRAVCPRIGDFAGLRGRADPGGKFGNEFIESIMPNGTWLPPRGHHELAKCQIAEGDRPPRSGNRVDVDAGLRN